MRRRLTPAFAALTLLTVTALAALGLIAACGGGGGGSSPTEPPPSGSPPPSGNQIITIEVVDNTYNPRSVTVNPGDTVRWVLRGSNAGHTVTDRNGAFDSGFVFNNNGDTYQHTFTAADNEKTFEYHCASHDDCCQMRGSVRVGANAPPPSPSYE